MTLKLKRRESAAVEAATQYYVNGDLKAWPPGKTIYYLNVDLEATPEETALIEQHGWGAMPLCKGVLPGGAGRVDFGLSDIIGTMRIGFDSFENRAYVESQLTENIDKVKRHLGDFASGDMSAARRKLADLYKRVVQDELGFAATVDKDGDIFFEHPDLGELFISLNADRDPEYMKLMLPAFFDASRGVSRGDLVEICNRINCTAKLTSLTVRDDAEGSVVASVGLLLAAPDTAPSEALLRGVIKRAMSSLEGAVKKFGAAIEG